MSGRFETEIVQQLGQTIWDEEHRQLCRSYRNSHIYWQGKVYWHDDEGRTLVHETSYYQFPRKRTLKAHLERHVQGLEHERARTGERPRELRYAEPRGPVEPTTDPLEVVRGSPEWDAAWRGLRAQLSALGFPPTRHRQDELEADGWRLVRSERLRPGLSGWPPNMRRHYHEFFHADHPAMEDRRAVFVTRPVHRLDD